MSKLCLQDAEIWYIFTHSTSCAIRFCRTLLLPLEDMLGGTRSFPLQSGFVQMWYTPIDGGDFLNLRGFSQHCLTDPMHILGIFLVITFICHSIPLYYCPMRVQWFFCFFSPIFSGFTENIFTSHVINMAGRLSHSEATAVSHVLRVDATILVNLCMEDITWILYNYS